MYSPERILSIINERKCKKVDVYTAIGLSRQGFGELLRGRTKPSFSTLEKLADYFDVPIDYFFGREHHSNANHGIQVNGNNVSGDLVVNELNHLKELLSEKDAQLAEKERTIQILLKNVQGQ